MRTWRLSLSGMVILALVGGLSVAVVAQDEADPMAPAYFTFTRGMASKSIGGEGEDDDGDGIPELRGQTEVDIPVEASDPRASGLWTFTINAEFVETAGGVVGMDTRSDRLVNDDGFWMGTGMAVSVFGEDDDRAAGLTVLTGEGGYDGLSLILSQSYEDGVESYWGVILPSDKVSPMPDPIEPPAG